MFIWYLLKIEVLVPLLFIILLLFYSVKVLKEYERAVHFRLGKFKKVRGPGLIFIIPFIDSIVRVDLRIVSIDVPKQEIITKDNVPVTIDAVVYFQIVDPANAIIKIANFYQSTFLIAQTTLRSMLGNVSLDELLTQREKINKELQRIIDVQTLPWGVKVLLVEIKEVVLPENMRRAIAKQAEAERERRAKIINAEGEFQAAQRLLEAAQIISKDPASLHLRYLQTLREVAVENNSTTIFPLPIEVLKAFLRQVE